MAAHESQFFEWLPWTSGKFDEVPKTEDERLKWLANWRKPGINEKTHDSLVKWYGNEIAEKAKYAEAFEICEYGRIPSDEEIRKLFPILGN
jgi:hypothetical protein